MEKVMITIPKELLEEIDLQRKKLGQNRSEFIRNVIIEYLKSREEFNGLAAKNYIEISKQDCDE
jgi:metal-responsive CopG/Arc/MetJ family transcriptional regulator